MRAHSNHCDLQHWGLAAMWAIIEEGGEAALQSMIATEALQAGVQALQTFPAEHEVQHWGLAFLRALICNCDEVTVATVVASGGLDAVIVVLTSAPDNVEVQKR